jgi:hypothetical protein
MSKNQFLIYSSLESYATSWEYLAFQELFITMVNNQSSAALWMQQVHRTWAATLQQWQLAMGAQNFETLHWNAENHGWHQKVANYAIAYGIHG